MQAYLFEETPISTTIWKGKVCLIIQFSGCDFKCPYCNKPALVEFKEENLRDIREIKKIIEENSSHIEAVFFTGGEPCLQRLALLELAKTAKDNSLLIGLDTNGSKPSVINELISKGMVDLINLDIKCRLDPSTFEKVTRSSTFFIPSSEIIKNLKETIGILKTSDLTVEITTLIVPSIMFRKEDFLEIANLIKEMNAFWTIRQFDNSSVLSNNLAGVAPPSHKFMQTIKDAILDEFPDMNIELEFNEEE